MGEYWLETITRKIKETMDINMRPYPSNSHALQTTKWWPTPGQKNYSIFLFCRSATKPGKSFILKKDMV